ncbi:uncharacterized protein [Diadema antillarum]|uniref:uncharacterized protein n=1 Tax=Diadema antillarum TaxID=105358 RepID=UPI003A859E6B
MITIISNRVHDRITTDSKREMQHCHIKLQQANGAEITVYGTTTMQMQIGQTCLDVQVVVADISNEGILGMDVLTQTECLIDCSRCELRCNHYIIPCISSGDDMFHTRQINTADGEMVPEFLHDLLERSQSNIETSDYPQLNKLSVYQDVFSKGDHDLGRTDRITHSIHTSCEAPIRQRPRRPPMGQREEIERQVQDMLDRGIITPSSNPWSSPVV